jgi:hypothetical protein
MKALAAEDAVPVAKARLLRASVAPLRPNGSRQGGA